MLDWLQNNWSTLFVGAILLVIVGLVIRKMIKDKRAGRSVGCGCGCKGCALAGKCGKSESDQ